MFYDSFSKVFTTHAHKIFDTTPPVTDDAAWTAFIDSIRNATIAIEGFKVSPSKGNNRHKSFACALTAPNGQKHILSVEEYGWSNHTELNVYLECNIKTDSSYVQVPKYKQAGVPVLLAKIPDIEAEWKRRELEIEKRDKIDKIARNSIRSWLSQIMKTSGYEYRIDEDKTRFLLTVRIKQQLQLEINIKIRDFQTTMPTVLETIKLYEQMATQSKMKVLIKNFNRNTIFTKS